ncbi:autoinducer binding domain-containing protein [Azospirillum sp. ST 5-10]|uniref:autoinducer binding domain-containing protein n=1 Tax=unclassified Azospirillum TaxID=2630922 RepID=UPI003F49C537
MAADARLAAQVDAAFDRVKALGFDALIYDYAPVPRTHDGRLINPSVLEMRNVPADMADLWCNRGYYQLDPVQDAALAVSSPFTWSHAGAQSDVMARVLRDSHGPVVRYLQDRKLTCGITVPIRLAGGDLATFTAIRVDPPRGAEARLPPALAEIALLGHRFHDAVFPGFAAAVRTCPHVHLTRRERECLRLCAEGLTAKEIAFRIDRSIPTVTFHLNAAIRKLGARNRLQAIARAAHYRLLDPEP